MERLAHTFPSIRWLLPVPFGSTISSMRTLPVMRRNGAPKSAGQFFRPLVISAESEHLSPLFLRLIRHELSPPLFRFWQLRSLFVALVRNFPGTSSFDPT